MPSSNSNSRNNEKISNAEFGPDFKAQANNRTVNEYGEKVRRPSPYMKALIRRPGLRVASRRPLPDFKAQVRDGPQKRSRSPVREEADTQDVGQASENQNPPASQGSAELLASSNLIEAHVVDDEAIDVAEVVVERKMQRKLLNLVCLVLVVVVVVVTTVAILASGNEPTDAAVVHTGANCTDAIPLVADGVIQKYDLGMYKYFILSCWPFGVGCVPSFLSDPPFRFDSQCYCRHKYHHTLRFTSTGSLVFF